MNVGELYRSIQKPISIYVNEIVQALHEKLCKDLLTVGICRTPEDCNKKTEPTDLCKSCNSWFKELAALHEKGNNPSWHKNCKSAKWPEDHWEVAKFFMPALGSNLTTVKDAESTDISSLLHVLEWMNNGAFLGKTRVNFNLARKLRFKVRNTWAQAPQQELSDDEMSHNFSIAIDFLEDLEKVWSHAETGKCLKNLENLKTSGVTNVVESELQSLLLQRGLLNDIKEEIIKIKVERSSDKSTIEEHEEKLTNLERALDECSQRMSNFESFKDNKNKQEKVREPTSCLPDKLPYFTARAAEVQKVITFLMNEEKAVVSLHGGPGFGKTAIAIEVSHKLSEDYNIPVVFSELTTATSVDEMIRQLCLDVAVNHEDENPKSSLILWLKDIKHKVIFVMDYLDNLLDDKSRSDFYDFVRLLRKNSNQHCQIVTTSRSSYEIRELATGEVNVEEMDVEACTELMKKQSQEKDSKSRRFYEDDNFLRRLAELCGKIPLAMCIAGYRVKDFDNPNEVLQHLEKQPLRFLKYPKTDQFVYGAINMSYEKCSGKEKETLVCLSVFNGSFSKEAARAVIEKDDLGTTDILDTLVHLSMIKEPLEHRYSFHLLIKHFLLEQQNSEDETVAERTKAQATRAKLLMVKYYLKLGHDLTMKSYSKDKYKESREALKKEAHNIQNVLEICCEQSGTTTSDISDCLANSEIYTTSARHFSLFVRTIIPGSIVDQFLQRCADMAEKKQQHAFKINFDCLLADQERIKSVNGLSSDFDAKMEEIRREFQTHHEDLKEEKSLCAHYYYLYGRYLLRKSDSEKGKNGRLKQQVSAHEQLEKSLQLRQELAKTPVEIADMVYSLLQLGNICKKISTTEFHLRNTHKSQNASKQVEEYYNEAIKLSEENLGEHELTSSCHKYLGDFLFPNKKSRKAEKEYTNAKDMRENLGLDANERHVFLLNNLGQCLTRNNKATEAIKILKSARDMAEKLSESDQPNKCKTKVYASLAFAYESIEKYIEAAHYANKALESEEFINPNFYEQICKIASNNV